MTLSSGSSVLCEPTDRPPLGQPVIFVPQFLTVIDNTPGTYITVASLVQDPRGIDLSIVSDQDKILMQVDDDPWEFPLHGTNLVVTMTLRGWDVNDEAVVDIDASPLVQFHALRGNTP